MKLKAIIADDERYVCELLKCLIDWESLGFEITGVAHDGESAYRLICETQPDIAVIDIKMPGYDGLNVVKRVFDKNLNVSFLLISGHKNFEYAHAAIRYRVENYLLKPINKQELEDTVLAMRNQIMERRSLKDLKSQTEQILADNVARMRKQYVCLLAEAPERVTKMGTREIEERYGLCFKSGRYCALAVSVDGKSDLDNMQMEIISNQLARMFGKYIFGALEIESAVTESGLVFILNYTDSDAVLNSVRETLEQAAANYNEYCFITAGVSSEGDDPGALRIQEAFEALEYRLALGCGKLFFYGREVFNREYRLSVRGSQMLLQALEIYDRDAVGRWFDQFGRDICPREIHPGSIYRAAMELGHLLTGASHEETGPPLAFGELIRASTDKRELVKLVRSWFLAHIDMARAHDERSNSIQMKQAMRYIRSHYQESLSLEELAKQVHLTPNYFCAMFKKEEGLTFNEYLTNCRIEAAKKLLQDVEMNISEIAARVGYQDSRYFSKIFTKKVGVKPSEYRRLYV